MIQWFLDLLLEIHIQTALNRLLMETDRTRQRQHAQHMADLIKRRSPGRVEKMERRAGLL